MRRTGAALLLLLPALSWSKRLSNQRQGGDLSDEGFTRTDDGQFWVKPNPVEQITPGEMRDLHRKGMRMHEVKEKYFKEFGKNLNKKHPDANIPDDYIHQDEHEEKIVDLTTSDERSGSLQGSSFANTTTNGTKGPEEHCRLLPILQQGIADRKMYFFYDTQDSHASVGCLSEPTTYHEVSCLKTECAGQPWCFVPAKCSHCDDAKKAKNKFGFSCCRPVSPEPTCKPMKEVVTSKPTAKGCDSPVVRSEWKKQGLWASEFNGKEATLRCRTDSNNQYKVKCEKSTKVNAACPSTKEGDFAKDAYQSCPNGVGNDIMKYQLRSVKSDDKVGRFTLACKEQQSITFKASCLKKDCKDSLWCFIKCNRVSGCWKDEKVQPKCPDAEAVQVLVEAQDLLMVKASFKSDGGEWLRLNWVATVKEVKLKDGVIKAYVGGAVDKTFDILPSELSNFRKIDFRAAALSKQTFKGVSAVRADKDSLGSPVVKLVFDPEATYETIYRSNPALIAEVLKKPSKFPQLPADFLEYVQLKTDKMCDWFDVGEVWTDYFQHDYIVLGYDYLEAATTIRPFDYKVGDPMTKVKVESMYEHRGNSYKGIESVTEPMKITIRSSNKQILYSTPEITMFMGRNRPPDTEVEFQMIPGDIPGTMFLATLDFAYIKAVKENMEHGVKKTRWVLKLVGVKGRSTDGGLGAKTQGTPFYVIYHMDGTMSLQTLDGYFVRPHHPLDGSKMVAEETRFDPEQHSFNFDLSLADPKQTSEELAPPSTIRPSLLSGYFCVQFDLDLWMISMGTFPGLISVSFMAEVHKIPETGCWGWSGSLQFQVSIGFSVAGFDFRAGVQMVATLQVDEVPLSQAESDLQWILPADHNPDSCTSTDPFDLFSVTVDSAWKFVRRKFLKNPFNDQFWNNPEVAAGKLVRREELDAAGIQDYQNLMSPPVGQGNVDDPVKLWVMGWSGDLKITVWVDPAFMARIRGAKLKMSVFQDIGKVSYVEESLPKPVASEVDFFFHLDPGSDMAVLVSLSILQSDFLIHSISGRLNPVTDQKQAKTVMERMHQSTLIDPKKQSRDVLSLTYLDARLVETTTGSCKGQDIKSVRLDVSASPLSQYAATWSKDMLGDVETGEFNNPFGMSLEDDTDLASTAEGLGITASSGDVDPFQSMISLQKMSPTEIQKLIQTGMTSGGACWKQVGSGLCSTLTALAQGPTGEAGNILSRSRIIEDFLIGLFDDAATRRALVETVQRPALRHSFEALAAYLPEEVIECARNALERKSTADNTEASAMDEAIWEAITKCHHKPYTRTDEEEDLDVKYVWKWKMFEGHTINNNNAATCSAIKIPPVVIAKDDMKEVRACWSRCQQHQEDVVQRNISGTLDRAEVGYCNAIRFESFPSTAGGKCLFFDCSRWDKFDEQKGHAVIVHMLVAVEGEKHAVPADVALASAPREVLKDVFKSLNDTGIRQVLDGLGAYILAAKEKETPENLAKPIKEKWKAMTTDVLSSCQSTPILPRLEDLAFRLPATETPVETIIKGCLFQDDDFLSDQALKGILETTMLVKDTKQIKITTKAITEKNKAIPEQTKTIDVSKRNTLWTEELSFSASSGCDVKVKSTWAWKAGNSRGWMTRPEVVPVAQAFFAAFDQFSSKLVPYSEQVLDRLQHTAEIALFSKLGYSSANGRVLHRSVDMEDLDAGKIDVSKGDVAVGDAVFNYPMVFKKSKYRNWPSFAYNSGLSVANLFLRAISDIQGLFNLYFANHPDWDGQCMSLPSRFHLFYEGNDVDTSKWKMHAESNTDKRTGKGTLPKYRAGNTVGEKGEKLTDDEKKLFLDWHWIAEPFWRNGKEDRAKFLKTSPPLHGTDHFSLLEPGNANAIMWPAIWCELVEQQWVVHKIAAVEKQLNQDETVLKVKYQEAEGSGRLEKVPSGLKVDLPKMNALLDQKLLTCSVMFPAGMTAFQNLIERREFEQAQKLIGNVGMVEHWQEAYEQQRKVHEFMEKKVVPFLRAQVTGLRSSKQATCDNGYLQDGLCWIWGAATMKAREPWRAPTVEEFTYRPEFHHLQGHCGAAILGDQEGKCQLKDLCLCRLADDKACDCGKRGKSIILVSPAKGDMDVEAITRSAIMPKDKALSKLEKQVDTVEGLVGSIFRKRQSEAATIHNIGVLMENLMSPDYLSNAEMRATAYAQLRTAKDTWEALTLEKANSWTSLFGQASNLTGEILVALAADTKKDGEAILSTMSYAETFSLAAIGVQKRSIGEFGILLSCLEQALRPISLSRDGLTPFISEQQFQGLEDQVKSLVGSGELNGGFDIDGVDLYFDRGCAVPTTFNGTGETSGSQRPECERTVLTKSFVTIMPGFAQYIMTTFHDFEGDLRELLEKPKLEKAEAMVQRLVKFLKNFRSKLSDDFFQAFAYHSDGTLHGEMWRSLTNALTTIRLTMDERAAKRQEWLTESVALKAEFGTTRRLRARSKSAEELKEEAKEMPSNVPGCACQKAWSARLFSGLSSKSKTFQGCVKVESLKNKEDGKIFWFKDKYLTWPGICEATDAQSGRCKEKGYVPCDPSKTWKDFEQTLIWRRSDPLRKNLVKLPVFTIAFYATIDVRLSRSDFCTPDFSEIIFEASFAWAESSWKPYEEQFSQCLTVRIQPPGAGLHITRCRHKTQDALTGEHSAYTEWNIKGTFYIVSTVDVWGTGDGDMTKSWFGGGDTSWTSTFSQNGFPGAIANGQVWSNPGGYGAGAELPEGFGYLSAEEVISSPYAFIFGMVAKAITAFVISEYIGGVTAKDPTKGSDEHSSKSAKKALMPLASIIWTVMKQVGFIPKNWVETITSKLVSKTVGQFVFSPCRNEQDVLLTLSKSWEFRKQVRPFNDLIEDLSGEQVLTALHHAKNLGAKVDQQWDEYTSSHITSMNRISVATAQKIVLDYMNSVEDGFLWKNKLVIPLQDQLMRLFVGCDGWPTWFKVDTDLPVYPCWKPDPASWVKDPLQPRAEVLLLSWDSSWYRWIQPGVDEDQFFSKELVSGGLLKIVRGLLDKGDLPFMTEAAFNDLLESTKPETVQCMARNAQLQMKQAIVPSSTAVALPALSRTHLGQMTTKDTGFSAAFFREFFNVKWPAFKKELKALNKEAEFFKVFSRSQSKIKWNTQQMAEVHETRTSYWSCALSLLTRWSPTFITIPGLLQVQPYVQLQLDFDVRQIISALRARLGGGKSGKTTALTGRSARVRKCMSCVQEGKAFCDRRSAADHMLKTGHAPTMDACMPKTRAAQRACHQFLWNVSTDTTSLFSQQVCPCYDSSTGESISPDWITSTKRCDDMTWPDEYQDTKRNAKLKDWQDGIAAAKQSSKRKKGRGKRVAMKKTFNFDRSFEARFDAEQKLRKNNEASCGNGYICCEYLSRFRCMEKQSLKDTAGMFSSTWRFVSRGDPCSFYQEPEAWKTAKEAHRCSQKTKSPEFEGYWYRLSKEWVQKPTFMGSLEVKDGADAR